MQAYILSLILIEGQIIVASRRGLVFPTAVGRIYSVSRVVSRTGALLGVTPDNSRYIDESDLLPLIWKGPDPKKTADVYNPYEEPYDERV